MGNMLGSRIRYLREKSHYSQKQMAEKLRITNVQLSRYESGARKPDPEMIVNIADFFDVSTDFLLGRSASVNEFSAAYITPQDVQLLESIREKDGMIDFINDLLEHPDHLNKLQKIWMIIFHS